MLNYQRVEEKKSTGNFWDFPMKMRGDPPVMFPWFPSPMVEEKHAVKPVTKHTKNMGGLSLALPNEMCLSHRCFSQQTNGLSGGYSIPTGKITFSKGLDP